MTSNLKRAILGTVQLGTAYGLGKWKQTLMPKSTAFNILHRAWVLGVRTLDTSPDYGVAETRIQSFLEEYPKQKFKIITKLKIKDFNDVEAEYENWFRKSKILANKDVKKCVLIHNEACIHFDFVTRKLDSLKAQGKIDEWGISIYSPALVPDILKSPGCEIVQLPYSILNPQPAMDAAMRTLHLHGKQVHARSIFTQGLIFNKRNDGAEPKELAEFRKQLLRYSEEKGIPVSAIAMQFINRSRWINKFLIGADSADHLDDLARVYDHTEDIKIMENLRSLAIKIPIDVVSPQTWGGQ